MEVKQLKEQVLKFLSYRPRSVAEVTRYLHTKTSDETLINQTLEFLKKFKLVDDAAFAKWLVESRSRSRPRGVRLLQHELKSKGIELSTINSQLSTLGEKDLALQALQKKLSRWENLNFRDFRVKAGRFLQSRGFSWGVIEEAIKTGYSQKPDS
jgi:regulatory protein